MSTIELRNVHKRFGATRVLTAVDLSIDAGEFCVFIGPSGCGKSTLLRTIAGLEDPSEGELRIGGRVVNELPPAQRDVAMVFQSYALYPHMSVYENMAFGLRHQKLATDEIDRRVRAAAQSLHLDGLLQRKPRELSGGQRQRVAIGRAIVRKPKVFLFDEPLSNLDAALRVKTRLEIAKLHRELDGVSMVYVTHDQVEAMTLADKIVLLWPDAIGQGRPSVAQVGTPLELYHRPRNLFVAGFIGSPAMNFLPAKVKAGRPGSVDVALGEGWTQAVAVSQPLQCDEPLTLGVRPEHVKLGAGPGRGTVSHVEPLGETTQVYLQLPQHDALFVAKTSGPAPRLGETLSFDLVPEHVHLFRADGEAVERPPTA
jgi:multiple sugar transport system ATP-binding protein